ncbi:MAG: hypothetical protein XD50_1344 [Clostridia bacterium 41_269]|nr:MAG: hypothetical protein XD50_1344 [Clostridia bacterium 41_269]
MKNKRDEEFVYLTTKRNGMEICNIFPKRSDPENVERFKKCIAEMILGKVEKKG